MVYFEGALLWLVTVTGATAASNFDTKIQQQGSLKGGVPSAVICPDDTIFAKLQIESAIGALSKHRGNGYDYPKDHENNEGFFKRYPKGINTGLEEYPILLEEGQWNPGDDPKLYRVVVQKDQTSNSYVGVVKDKGDQSGGFVLCENHLGGAMPNMRKKNKKSTTKKSTTKKSTTKKSTTKKPSRKATKKTKPRKNTKN